MMKTKRKQQTRNVARDSSLKIDLPTALSKLHTISLRGRGKSKKEQNLK